MDNGTAHATPCSTVQAPPPDGSAARGARATAATLRGAREVPPAVGRGRANGHQKGLVRGINAMTGVA